MGKLDELERMLAAAKAAGFRSDRPIHGEDIAFVLTLVNAAPALLKGWRAACRLVDNIDRLDAQVAIPSSYKAQQEALRDFRAARAEFDG